MLILAFRTNVHLVNYNAFRKISHVRPLYPVAPGDFIKYRFLEFAHNRTFFEAHKNRVRNEVSSQPFGSGT